MRKQDAFTLIELLVVIAIIALLMGILLPSLNKARQQGKKIVCTAHMKGLGISLRMYVDDNNGKTHRSPNEGLWDTAYEGSPIVRPFAPDDSFAYWGIAYYPYSKNKKVFHCPSTGRADDWPERGWGVAYQRYFRYCSYGINGYITWNSEENRNVMIDRDFKKHDEVIAFQDHIEQKLDGINSDMFCIGPSVRINLRQWRPASQGARASSTSTGRGMTRWGSVSVTRDCPIPAGSTGMSAASRKPPARMSPSTGTPA
jgi:prepilin-type N-terminal cleavage/methylation domain-containing protein